MRPIIPSTVLLVLLLAVCARAGEVSRTVDLFGNATLGYYFINIYVGDKMRRQSLIVDTGSSMITFPCRGSGG